MKILIFALTLLFGGNVMAETHEFVLFKFKKELSHVEQSKLMKEIDSCAKKLKGFKSREYYFSESDNRWIDHVVWETAADAKNASQEIMKVPEAQMVFSHIDESSISMSHYLKK